MIAWLLACTAAPPAPEPAAPVAEPAPAAEPAAVAAPVEGGPVWLEPRPCEPCTLVEQVDGALLRLGPFLAEWQGRTRVDAAIAVHEIREVVDSPALSRAWERVRAVADEDADHLHRRVWAELEVEPTNAWTLPEQGRPSLNRVMAEALWCDVYPIRDETLAYFADGMLDEGGYWTAHAAWSVAEARERGCIDAARAAALAEPILADLLAHQPAALDEPSVPELDLFAERLLGLLWLEHRGPEVERSVRVLLAHQAEDGGWGQPSAEDNPYYGYHAAFAAGWALAEWRRDYSSAGTP